MLSVTPEHCVLCLLLHLPRLVNHSLGAISLQINKTKSARRTSLRRSHPASQQQPRR